MAESDDKKGPTKKSKRAGLASRPLVQRTTKTTIPTGTGGVEINPGSVEQGTSGKAPEVAPEEISQPAGDTSVDVEIPQREAKKSVPVSKVGGKSDFDELLRVIVEGFPNKDPKQVTVAVHDDFHKKLSYMATVLDVNKTTMLNAMLRFVFEGYEKEFQALVRKHNKSMF